MKAIKKIISILLAFSLFPAAVSFAAEEKNESEYFKLFTQLNIVDNYETEEEFFKIKTISRGDFAQMVSKLFDEKIPDSIKQTPSFTDISGNEYENAVERCYDLGIVSGNAKDRFFPGLAIKYEEAAVMLIKALGYDIYINGEYPTSYVTKASDIGIFDGISYKIGENVTKSDALKMFYNLFDINVIKVDYDGGKYTISNDENLSVFGKRRDIFKVRGVMKQNTFTSEDGATDFLSGKVYIDDEEYTNNCSDADDFLGMNVEAFYKLDGGEKILLSVLPYKNNIISVESENIVSVNSDCKLMEYEDDRGRTKSIKISPVCKVIYNGIAYPEYTAENFQPADGKVTFIDNDNDEKYDWVFIDEYRIFVVDNISVINKEITGRYSFDGALKTISVEEKPEVCVEFYKDGEKISYKDLSKNDVLLVTKSKTTGSTKIKAVVSNQTVSGKYNSVDWTNKYITVDDEKIKMSGDFILALQASDSALPALQGGYSFDIYLDCRGRVAYIALSGSGVGDYYGYLKSVKMYDGEEKAFVRLFSETGEWKDIELRSKTNVDGRRMDAEQVYDYFVPDGIMQRQLIKYHLVNGVITKIETAEITSRYDKDKFTSTGKKSDRYRWTARNLGANAFLNDDLKVFIIPINGSVEEEMCEIKGISYFVTDKSYSYCAYNLDEFKRTSLILIEDSVSNMNKRNKKSDYFVVKSVGMRTNNDDEAVQSITGAYVGQEEITILGKSANMFSGLKRGDVLRLSISMDGSVSDFETLFTYETDYGTIGKSSSEFYNEDVRSKGYILKADNTAGRFLVNDGSEHIMAANNDSIIWIVDKTNKNIVKGSLSDIREGDYYFAYISWWIAKQIVIYR